MRIFSYCLLCKNNKIEMRKLLALPNALEKKGTKGLRISINEKRSPYSTQKRLVQYRILYNKGIGEG